MNLWSIIDTILDWSCNWRFNLCFYGSLILAAVAASGIPNETVRAFAAAGIFIAGFVTGMCWNSSS